MWVFVVVECANLRILQKKDEHLWKGADALVLAQGTPDDDNPYKKTNALQYWLLGYQHTSKFSLVITLKLLGTSLQIL